MQRRAAVAVGSAIDSLRLQGSDSRDGGAMTRLGFVGTGTMGAPIALHLVEAGHDVRVFDRFPAAMDPVLAAGAAAATSAADAAAGAACVFLSLPAPGDVEAAVSGPDGVLDATPRPHQIVDLSTNSPGMVARLHERCADAGVGFVDAPVSGGRAKAQTGELSVLVGACDDDFAAVRPLLECFGGELFHVGAPGAGTVAKLVNNQLFLAAGVLVQEAYVLGAAAGLEPSVLHRIIKASSAGPYAALAPLLLGRRFDDVHLPPRHRHQGPDVGGRGGAGATGWRCRPAPARSSVYRDALAAGHGQRGVPRHPQATRAVGRDRASCRSPARRGRRDRRRGHAGRSVRRRDASAPASPTSSSRWLRDHQPVYWHEPTPRTPDGEGSGSSAATPT